MSLRLIFFYCCLALFLTAAFYLVSPQVFLRAAAMVKKGATKVAAYQQIEIHGLKYLSTSQVMRELRLVEEPYLWQTSLGELLSRVSRSPWVEQVEIERGYFPLSLTIRVREATPWLVAQLERHSWLVSSSGNLIQELSLVSNPGLVMLTESLPRLSGLERGESDTVLLSTNTRLAYACRMVAYLETEQVLPYKPERFHLMDDGSLLVRAWEVHEPQVRLHVNSLEEAAESKHRLVSVLKDIAQRREVVKEIDLRFNKQVVVN